MAVGLCRLGLGLRLRGLRLRGLRLGGPAVCSSGGFSGLARLAYGPDDLSDVHGVALALGDGRQHAEQIDKAQDAVRDRLGGGDEQPPA